MTDPDTRLDEHDFKLMELENTLGTLNEELLAIKRQHQSLQTAHDRLLARIEAALEQGADDAAHDTAPPPHY